MEEELNAFFDVLESDLLFFLFLRLQLSLLGEALLDELEDDDLILADDVLAHDALQC